MTNTETNLPLDQIRERIAFLKEFLLEERVNTLETALSSRTDYMTVLTENTFHAQNASAIVRHCEAFGVQNLHNITELCPFDASLNIVRGTDKWVDIHTHPTTEDAISCLREQGYRLIATTPHRKSCTPETFDVSKGPFAVVFGTEKTGISDKIIEQADEFMMIPMCGMVESLNVSASAAIILYILSARMRASGCQWELDPSRHDRILYKWLKEAVRDSRELLERRYGNSL